MQPHAPAGWFRLLCAAFLCVLLLPQAVRAASINWSSLGDRERVTITLLPNDGFPGTATRVDTQGIIIPFSEVPPDLLINEPPAGAKLFQRTEQLGTALAIMTQTPEFGFVVSKQTPGMVVIDFFADPLGARWKPTPRTPAIPAVQGAAAASAPATVQTPPETAPATPPPAPATDTPPPAPPAATPVAPVTPAAPPVAPGTQPATVAPPVPPAASAGGAPPVSAAPQPALPQGTAQPAAAPSVGTAPPSQNGAATLPDIPVQPSDTSLRPPPPFLDTRQETSPRVAPLPNVPPPSSTAAPAGAGAGQQIAPPPPPPPGTGAQGAPVPPVSSRGVNAGDLGIAMVPQVGTAAVPSLLAQAANQQLPASVAVPGSAANSAVPAAPSPPPVPPQTGAATVPPSGGGTPAAGTAAPQPPTPPVAAAQPPPPPVAAAQGAEAPGASLHAAPTPAPVGQQPAQVEHPFLGVEDEKLPKGSAVFAGPGVTYRGRFNYGGEDKVEPVVAPAPPRMLGATGTPPAQDQNLGAAATGRASTTETSSAAKSPPAASGAEGVPPATQAVPAAPQATPDAAQPALPAAQAVPATPPASKNAAQPAPPPAGQPAEHPAATEPEKSTPPPPESGRETAPPAGGHALEKTPAAEKGAAQPAAQPPAGGHPPAKAPAGGHGAAKAPATGNGTAENVVYVDEKGNTIEPPADPAVVLPEVSRALGQKKFDEGLAKVEKLLQQSNLSRDQREEALHLRAEVLFSKHQEDLGANFQTIAQATTQAINFNQLSQRNAGALLRLGYLNLRVKNIPEAEAQFNLLRRQFPDDEHVPLTYYYWGDYYYGRNELPRAADQFQYVVQKFANSKIARESALGLARSYYGMGYFQEAFDVIDYIERRWSRFYLDYPPFLNMMGDVAFRLNKLDYALAHYWLYVNLAPKGEETDIILTRIGDIYAMQRQTNAAQAVYKESIARFPDRDGGLVARMRLAEAMINDDPTILGMFSVFDRPYDVSPQDVYKSIINDHSTSSLVPLAMLKLAMWQLWQKDYIATLDTATDFMNKFPQHELVPKIKEVALKAFAVLSSESVVDGRYSRMREIWERYPVVQSQQDILGPESRVALGVSYWKEGKPDDALEAIGSFFIGNRVPTYSEMALSLALNIYLEHDQWAAIREVAHRVELWELSPESQQQLDYALALSAENLGETDVAAPLWQKLHDSGTLPDVQRAYATYFLARNAEKNQELEKAYLLGLDALTRLTAIAEASPSQADLGKVITQLGSLMNVAEKAGRLNEALQYAQRYLEYLSAEDPERAAVLYRMARIHRQMGNDEAWRKGLTEIAQKYAGTVYGQTAASELKAAELTKGAAQYSPSGN